MWISKDQEEPRTLQFPYLIFLQIRDVLSQKRFSENVHHISLLQTFLNPHETSQISMVESMLTFHILNGIFSIAGRILVRTEQPQVVLYLQSFSTPQISQWGPFFTGFCALSPHGNGILLAGIIPTGNSDGFYDSSTSLWRVPSSLNGFSPAKNQCAVFGEGKWNPCRVVGVSVSRHKPKESRTGHCDISLRGVGGIRAALLGWKGGGWWAKGRERSEKTPRKFHLGVELWNHPGLENSSRI